MFRGPSTKVRPNEYYLWKEKNKKHYRIVSDSTYLCTVMLIRMARISQPV